jgi:hypothetical protein
VALGFASFAMSWLGLDSNGAPCTPVYTYAQSSQTLREAVEELLTSAGQQIKCDIWQRTGAPWFHNSYAAPRMLQHLKHDSTAGVCSWTTLTSFLLSRWTESTKERAIVRYVSPRSCLLLPSARSVLRGETHHLTASLRINMI